ncbi:MAG: trypsin-like peptidase domain-containing protein [Planctomycetota bacterium]
MTYDDPSITIGSAADMEVRIDHPAVAPRHAVLEYLEDDCAFLLRRKGGALFVNRSEIVEVMLQDGDLIEWGVNGPRSRFRIYIPHGSVCKPVRRMLADARDVQRHSDAKGAARGLTRDLFTQATMRLKVGFPLGVLLLALPMAWLAGWIGGRPSAATRRADDVTQAELEAMRAQQQAQAEELAALRAASAVMGEVQRRWSRGVCLVHGIVQLRWADDRPVTGVDGEPLLAEYTGSGFLVADDGRVLTNRHVVTPWETMASLDPILMRGAVPGFAVLTATFPGKAPVPVPIDSIRRRGDDLDVALFRLPADAVAGVPVLPLHDGPLETLPDQRAIVVGYPTGLAALLAKADAAQVQDLRARGADMTTVIRELAAADRISPVITQGTLGNVQERQLVYDAATTHGGSGGPVFGGDGTVIGVNYAILREFAGANFGVPIAFGRELLGN